jgi:hypothetical protein
MIIFYDLGLRSKCYSYMYTLLQKVQTGYGANRASYSMVAGELPKGIKRPKRGADNLLRPRAEVKNATAT